MNSGRQPFALIACISIAAAALLAPQIAFAAAPELSSQALLEIHRTQCGNNACAEPVIWKGLLLQPTMVLSAVMLVALGISDRVGHWIDRTFPRPILGKAALAMVLAACWTIPSFIIRLVTGYHPGPTAVIRQKDAHGNWFTPETRVPSLLERFGDWLGDIYLPAAIGTFLVILLAAFLLKRLRPRGLALLAVAFVCGFNVLADPLIAPASQPIPDQVLRNQVASWAIEAGYAADTIEIKKSHAFLGEDGPSPHNAMALSLPKPKIVLSPTLLPSRIPSPIRVNNVQLEPLTTRQLKALVGHELAHLQLHHQIKIVAAQLLIALVLSWLAFSRLFGWLAARYAQSGGHAPRLLTTALMSGATYWAVLMVLVLASNYIGRLAEAEADARGIEIAGDPEGAAQMLVRISIGKSLTQSSLLGEAFSTHPAPIERIAKAQAKARSQ